MRRRRTRPGTEPPLEGLQKLREEGRIERLDPVPEMPVATGRGDREPGREPPAPEEEEGDEGLARYILPRFDPGEDVEIELKLPDVRPVAVDPFDDRAGEDEAAEDVLAAPIEVYSPLMRKALADNGLSTFGDLVARTREQLLEMKGIGPATVDHLEARLRDKGLRLAEGAGGAGEAAPLPKPAERAPEGGVLQRAAELLESGDVEPALEEIGERVRRAVEAVIRSQELRDPPVSTIASLRRLVRDRQISSRTYEDLLGIVRTCAQAGSGRPVPADRASATLQHASTALRRLRSEVRGDAEDAAGA